MRTGRIIKWIIWGILLILLQVLVLNHLEINSYIYPQVYILVLISLPMNVDRRLAYLIGFVVGVIIDAFLFVPGLHAATCTFMMFIRQLYFKNFIEQEWYDSGLRPGIYSPETVWYLGYAGAFSFIFHLILFFLEEFSFHAPQVTFLRVILSSSISVLLILLLEYITDTPSNKEI